MTTSRAPNASDADAPQRAIVLTALAAARRRIRLTSFLRAASVACASGVALGAAAVLLPLNAPVSLPLFLGLTGLAGSVAWAIFQTPSLADTAAALDTRLALKDRAAAAFQLQDSSSPVARLVIHDAAARLGSLIPAAVFPLSIPRAALVLLPLAVVLAGSLTWRASSHRTDEATGAAMSAGAARASAANQAAGASSAARAGAGRPADRGQVNRSSPEIAAPRPGTAAGARPEPSRGEDAARAGGSRPPGSEVPIPSGANRRITDTAAPAAAPVEPRTAAAEPANAGAGTRDGRGADTAPRGTAANATGASRAGRGASGADASIQANAARGAGGVSRGTLTPGAPFEAAGPPAGLTAHYGAARTAAEAALARDAVPPDLRDYVRDYFRAIAPAGER